MNIKSKLKFFAGHESFYLREGWLVKGLIALKNHPLLFKGSELTTAIDTLGVGSNMVKSIRYWLEVSGLIYKSSYKNNTYDLTDLAELIMIYDPYMQHKSTLWILHSQVSSNFPLWHFIANESITNSFNKESVIERIDNRLKELDSTFAKKTIKDSVNVFINSYLLNKKIDDPENNILSPFSKLKLLKNTSLLYSFSNISFNDFPPYLIYLLPTSTLQKGDEIHIDEVHLLINRMMKIDYNNTRKTIDYLEHEGLIHIDRAAGLNNIKIKTNLDTKELYLLMLEKY